MTWDSEATGAPGKRELLVSSHNISEILLLHSTDCSVAVYSGHVEACERQRSVENVKYMHNYEKKEQNELQQFLLEWLPMVEMWWNWHDVGVVLHFWRWSIICICNWLPEIYERDSVVKYAVCKLPVRSEWKHKARGKQVHVGEFESLFRSWATNFSDGLLDFEN